MGDALNYKGKFITFEGIEGSGKSTNLSFVAKLLKENNVELTITREPGGTVIGEELRNILLTKHLEKITTTTELLLMFAARSQHVENIILPALAKGHCVLSDRFTDASYAYQGGGRGLDIDKIAWLENLVQGSLRPDLTILFDLPGVIGMERISTRKNLDRIEQEKINFFENVRKTYLARANNMPERYVIIDASQDLEKVQQQLLNIFKL